MAKTLDIGVEILDRKEWMSRNKIERNSYMREYLRDRYKRRRAEAISYLGGQCVDCGMTDYLEFDHKDPEEKEFNVGSKFATMSWERLYPELDKCQLRCISCHAHITAFQRLKRKNVLGTII